jgi:signal transduction histidine kinase
VGAENDEKCLGIARELREAERCRDRAQTTAERFRILTELSCDYAYVVRIADGEAQGDESLEWASDTYLRGLLGLGDNPAAMLRGTLAYADSAGAVLGLRASLPDAMLAALPGPWSRCHPEDLPRVRAGIARVLRGETLAHEFRAYARTGEVRFISEHLRAAEDDPRRIYGAARDVTDQHTTRNAQTQLEAQLRQSQKMEAVGRLAGGVAHDFNNLLTVILTHCGFLLTDLPQNTQLHDDASDIQAAARRAAELTQRLLAFSRQQVLTPVVIELNTVLRELWPVLRSLVGDDIELSAHAADGPQHVRADRAQLEQIVLNLVVNARDAMPAGGKIELITRLSETCPAELRSAGAQGPFVHLLVRDTGSGMPDDVLARIFEPFFTTKEQGKGTGLGLSTVYGIVQQSGGAVAVDSKVGFGTTFDVVLPRVLAAVTQDKDAPARTEPRVGNGTILVVEDEEGVRRGVQRILRHAGYTVLVAADPAQALSVAEDYSATIDVLLTDVVMPMMSGVELATRIRSLRPTAKVLYMSGHARDTLNSEGDVRPVEFLQKPFTRQTLIEKVEVLLSEH